MFADIEYDTVFGKGVDDAGTKDVKKTIEEYVRKYTRAAASTYFKKGFLTIITRLR